MVRRMSVAVDARFGVCCDRAFWRRSQGWLLLNAPCAAIPHALRKKYARWARTSRVSVREHARSTGEHLKNCTLFRAKCGESTAAILRECAHDA